MTLPLVSITHGQDFSAAHRLHSDQLTESENQTLYGPCSNLHGHNYRYEVTVKGPVDGVTGMVMNLNDLAQLMREEIWEHVDHRNLCEDVPFLKGLVTTAENLAIAFWDRLASHGDRLCGAKLYRVRVIESPGNFVDYCGETK